MAKYKVGDKVRIVSKNPNAIGFTDEMEKYLGKTLTVINVWERPYGLSSYNFKEATVGNPSMDLPRKVSHWNFAESWISGLAEPEREPCTVELRFDGMITTATLKRGGRDVKTGAIRRIHTAERRVQGSPLSGFFRRSARRTSRRRASRRSGTSSWLPEIALVGKATTISKSAVLSSW